MNKKIYPSETLEVEIIRFSHKGMGQGEYIHPPEGSHSEGRKLFIDVPHTLPGDLVQVTVDNAKGRKRAQVDYDKIIKYAPSRIGQWGEKEAKEGGTPLRFMDYDSQLAYKEDEVKKYLAEEGFDLNLVFPIIGMEDPYHYRNKMELTFGSDYQLGMHEQGNFRSIIDMKDSPIATKEMQRAKDVVSDWQKAHQLPDYKKDSKQGLLRQLMLRQSIKKEEMMVALFATEGPENFPTADLLDKLREALPQIKSIIWLKNKDIADRSQAQESYNLYGRDFIYDELHGLTYRIWWDTFFQPNPIQAEIMVEIALDLAEIHSDMRVLDLFCGVGSFSLPLAQQAKELAGIEIVETSIESAKRNAKDNNLANTYFIARDARKGMAELEETWGRPDLVLLDPPRDGAGGKVMRRIGRLQTDRVIYVSCNPKSLARDLVYLRNFGYELKVVQPIDQFPHTLHVECVVLMSRAGK